jgi:hypothetical protein
MALLFLSVHVYFAENFWWLITVMAPQENAYVVANIWTESWYHVTRHAKFRSDLVPPNKVQDELKINKIKAIGMHARTG